ncbi:hypothetical protein M9H77_22702 [Catharanthus roseus]|uniref:Uncharacterized protein n=1 Tax=Catharanthus roseus TaxID=4058 RepID=A0ACC0AS53_CATRO|nr:hypothetical protein M9H77_22702 [Catharanthus roseus]
MELKLRLMTRARMKKLKASNANEDHGMLPFMESLKNLKAKERHLSCSQFAQLARIIQRNNLHPTTDGSPAATVAGRHLSESIDDVERESKETKGLWIGPFTSARPKKN